MPVDAEGRWRPGTSPKQDLLRQICQQKQSVLAQGPRMSGKSLGCLYALCEHAWNTWRGNAAIVTISQTVGYDAGIWKDLTEKVLPEWIDGDFGMRWVTKPMIVGLSKKPTCRILNRHGIGMDDEEAKAAGGITTIQLESLQDEKQVERRFKSRRYSCLYAPEMDVYKSEKTYATWGEALRIVGLPAEQHLFLADTNPPDSGSDSWMHDLWFKILDADPADLNEREQHQQKTLGRVDFSLEDNIWDSKDRIDQLKDRYAFDQNLYDRYIRGLWNKSSEDAIFYKVFRPNFHSVGDFPSKANPDPELMRPNPDCIELITGWDPGARNCAACIIEEVRPKLDQYANKPVFKVLDELVVVGEDVNLADFVGEMLEKMAKLETYLGKKIMWKHWSDRSVFDVRELGSNKYLQQLIWEASESQINLMAAERGKESVNAGLDLMRKLLYEERLFINEATCPNIKLMFTAIRRKKGQMAGVDKASPHKHALDCLRYPLQMQCYQEINASIIQNLRRKSESSLVSVG